MLPSPYKYAAFTLPVAVISEADVAPETDKLANVPTAVKLLETTLPVSYTHLTLPTNREV